MLSYANRELCFSLIFYLLDTQLGLGRLLVWLVTGWGVLVFYWVVFYSAR